MLSTCSPKTSKNNLPLKVPENFSQTGNKKLPDKWWKAFDSPKLNSVMKTALSENFNIQIAWEQLQASKAVAKRESSYLLPEFEGNSQAGIQFPTPDFIGGQTMQIGLASSYEIDLWGRIKARVQAEKFRVEANRLDYKTSAITLSARITLTWFRLSAAKQSLKVVNQQISSNKKIIDLLQARFGSGQIRNTDILRQKQLLADKKKQKSGIKQQIGVFQNQLKVLMGKTPQQKFNHQTDTLPALPPLPSTGVPAKLIQRRPDVQRDFLRLQAADREVAAAIMNQYPRLNLRASTALLSNSINNLFQTWVRSFSANIMAPLFYGNRLSAEADRTKAIKQQRVYQYGQSVLNAFQEVENALVQEKRQKEQITSIKEQIDLANKTYKQLKTQYFNGVANYLDVLTALNQKQDLQMQLINARLDLYEYRISLYRAIAGKIDTEREVNN